MKERDLKQLLDLIYKIFPIPTEDDEGEFKGQHTIGLKDGKPTIFIWILSHGKVNNYSKIVPYWISLDENEEVTEEILIKAKGMIEEQERLRV